MNDLSIVGFLSELRTRTIVLSIEGDRLRVNAPPGVMTQELRAQIAGRREEILRALQGELAAAQSNAHQIPRIPRGTPLPLSFAQQRLWFLGQMQGAREAYNIPWIFRIKGSLDVPVLRRALDRIMARHEALRTTFTISNGEPAQRISPDCRFPLVEEDFRPNSHAHAEVADVARAEAEAPFDLERGPVIRGRLIRLERDEYLLLLCVHHIAVDGWSMTLLARELGQLYTAFQRGDGDPLPEPEIQPADYAVWQREWMRAGHREEQAGYWKNALAGAPTLLELPTDHPRTAIQGYAGGFEELVLDEELTSSLKSFCARHRATLFMTLMATWAILLARLTGREDLLIGSPVANRRRRELERVIGFFANTLVIRLNLSGSPTVREVIAQSRTTCLKALENQDLPFEQIVELTHAERSLSYSPLVQVMFAWQNVDPPLLEMEGMETEPVRAERTKAKFELLLELQETDDRITGGIEFAASLFERSTIQRYIAYFRTLLASMIADDTQTVDRLPLLPESERRQILEEFASAKAPYPKDKCVHQLFEELAACAPGAVAVTCDGTQLTYGELNQRANKLAHYLRELGVKPDARVAVCLERNFEMLIALLATLKAGGAYVPLDPTYPAERLQFMLRDSAPIALLTQRSLQHIFAEVSDSIPLLDVMDKHAGWKGRPTTNPDPGDLTPSSLAYIIYTSGSTGQPKGAMVQHRGIVRLVRGANYATMTAEDRFLQMAPVSFDAATLEIWGALLNGATLVLLPGGKPSADEVIRTIREQRISFLWLTTPLFNVLVDANLEQIGAVKQVLTGGDTASPSHMRRFTAQLREGHSLVNGYGPTENTTFTTCYRMTKPHNWSGSVPIGRPISNTTVYILDRIGQPVPIGVPGELYTGGDGVALGYQNRPELTAERFVPDPFSSEPEARLYRTGDQARWLPDGNIEFLGRNDFQIKIRGFRVELGEIEALLTEYPAIVQAVVIAAEPSAGEKRLVAYYTSSPAADSQKYPLTAKALREYLLASLPEYMVPAAFVHMESLPLTSTGKIDRKSLPDPQISARAAGEYDPPEDELEGRIAAIWAELLEVDHVGRNDNFFEIGGHSLLAVQLVLNLRSILSGQCLPLNVILECPTVGALAARIRDRQLDREYPVLVQLRSGGSGKTPFFCIHAIDGTAVGMRSLALRMDSGRDFYCLQAKGLDGSSPFGSIEEAARFYLKEVKKTQPRGPYLLGGYCFGGMVAYEIARMLTQSGEQVQSLILIDAPNPAFLRNSPPGEMLRRLIIFYFHRAGMHLRTMASLDQHTRMRYVIGRGRAVVVHFHNYLRRIKGKQPLPPPDAVSALRAEQSAEDRLDKILARLTKLGPILTNRYTPQLYRGNALIIRVDERNDDPYEDYYLGWRSVLRGELKSIEVQSTHEDILREPDVRLLAEFIDAELTRRERAAREEELVPVRA